MNNINDNELKKYLKINVKDFSSNITFEQVWNKFSDEKNRNKKIFFSPKLTYIVIVSVLLLIVIPVTATVLPIDWNGIKISIIDDGGKNARRDAFKELIFGPNPSYKELIETTLSEELNMKGTFTLEEAKVEFPYTVLRPQENLIPSMSIGAAMNSVLQDDNGAKTVVGYNYVFHDFYELGDKWIIATQSLNEVATRYLLGEINGISSSYVGEWEYVHVDGKTLAMFVDDIKENKLILQYMTDENKVIELKLIGNVSKEELVMYAEAYIINN